MIAAVSTKRHYNNGSNEFELCGDSNKLIVNVRNGKVIKKRTQIWRIVRQHARILGKGLRSEYFLVSIFNRYVGYDWPIWKVLWLLVNIVSICFRCDPIFLFVESLVLNSIDKLFKISILDVHHKDGLLILIPLFQQTFNVQSPKD